MIEPPSECDSGAAEGADPPAPDRVGQGSGADHPLNADPTQETILVVDDDRDIARFVQMNLELHGFKAIVAHDAQEALALIVDRKPDLAVVDWRMPVMDGLELT